MSRCRLRPPTSQAARCVAPHLRYQEKLATWGTGASAGGEEDRQACWIPSLAMLVRQLHCDAQTMAAHEPMDHLEFRAKSPLAKQPYKSKARPKANAHGDTRKSERSCRHHQTPGLTESDGSEMCPQTHTISCTFRIPEWVVISRGRATLDLDAPPLPGRRT